MALIECPECGKKVSDRAKTCPECGYPIDEYVEQLEQEKQILLDAVEQAKYEELKKKRKIEYCEKAQYPFMGRIFTFSHNHVICANACSYLFDAYDRSIEEIKNMIIDGDEEERPSYFPSTVGTSGYIGDLVERIIGPVLDAAFVCCKHYIDNGKERTDEIGNYLSSEIDIIAIKESIYEVFRDACLDRENDEASSRNEYEQQLNRAGQPAMPIDEIYGNSLKSLIGAAISANLINAVTAGLTMRSVEERRQFAEDNFSNAIERIRLECDLKVYSALTDYLDDTYYKCKDAVLNFLVGDGALFEKIYYPKNKFDADNYQQLLQKEDTLNFKKKDLFVGGVEDNPAYPYLYVWGIESIDFSANEYREMIALLGLFEIKDAVINLLDEIDKNKALILKEGTDIDAICDTRDKQKQEAEEKKRRAKEIQKERKARTADGILFNTIQEKENYVADKKAIVELAHEIDSSFNFDDLKIVENEIIKKGLENFLSLYEKIVGTKEKLHTEKYINQVNTVIEKYELAYSEGKKYKGCPTYHLYFWLINYPKLDQFKIVSHEDIEDEIQKIVSDNGKLLKGLGGFEDIIISKEKIYCCPRDYKSRYHGRNYIIRKVYPIVVEDITAFEFEIVTYFVGAPECKGCHITIKNKKTFTLHPAYKSGFSKELEKVVMQCASLKNTYRTECEDESKNEEKEETKKETMFCPFCGKQILRTAKFCNFCGKQNNYNK